MPVDHQVNGEQIKYWRELRASKLVKWETFPQFPLVLNADGSPWAPACMWLLDRARANPLKMSSLNPVAQGLRAYKVFLDEFGLLWNDFSSVDKYLRPTYLYKAHLQDLINNGAIKHSTASGRMHAVVGFYRFLMESERMNFRAQNAPWVDRTVGLEYRDSKGFKQVREITTVDVAIKIGGFNRSMQHTMTRPGGRSVAHEAATPDLLHGAPESADVEALEGRLDPASDRPVV